jgi:membrane-bound metal-dependent hydrolase YbcI (DUF457 family)
MFVGHFAVGFIAKRREPRLSLGTCVLAATLADILWPIFLIAGLEQVQFKPGMGAANYFVASNIALSHSLLMDGLWGALFATTYFLSQRNVRSALILFAAVVSHWFLDVIAHRPDMPLAPVAHRYFGLGLWISIPATMVVEGGLWLLGIISYVRITRAKNWAGVYGFWIAIVLFTLLWYQNIAGSPPANPRAAPISSLIFFSLVVTWAYWMNSVRVLTSYSVRVHNLREKGS